MGALFWVVLLAYLHFGEPVEFNLSAVSWNVNGAAKLRTYPAELRYLATFDAILLQETFSLHEHLAFELDGFIAFHTEARPTGGRPSWGMSSLFKMSSFVGGRLRTVMSPCDWLQVRSVYSLDVYYIDLSKS